jgi:asparagine synthase (glutamine-hydrolysing)
LFDMAAIETLLNEHQSGARDHSAALWLLSMFEGFLRQVHSGAPASEPLRDAAVEVGA